MSVAILGWALGWRSLHNTMYINNVFCLAVIVCLTDLCWNLHKLISLFWSFILSQASFILSFLNNAGYRGVQSICTEHSNSSALCPTHTATQISLRKLEHYIIMVQWVTVRVMRLSILLKPFSREIHHYCGPAMHQMLCFDANQTK